MFRSAKLVLYLYIFLAVWAFDTDSECWSLMDAKGDVPVILTPQYTFRSLWLYGLDCEVT